MLFVAIFNNFSTFTLQVVGVVFILYINVIHSFLFFCNWDTSRLQSGDKIASTWRHLRSKSVPRWLLNYSQGSDLFLVVLVFSIFHIVVWYLSHLFFALFFMGFCIAVACNKLLFYGVFDNHKYFFVVALEINCAFNVKINARKMFLVFK